MKSKRFFLAFCLLAAVSLGSFSEERKIYLTEMEYNSIMMQLQNARKQLNEYKNAQSMDLMKLNQDFKNLSTYCREQEQEWIRKTLVYSIVGFSCGIVFASGAYVIINAKY